MKRKVAETKPMEERFPWRGPESFPKAGYFKAPASQASQLNCSYQYRGGGGSRDVAEG